MGIMHGYANFVYYELKVTVVEMLLFYHTFIKSFDLISESLPLSRDFDT